MAPVMVDALATLLTAPPYVQLLCLSPSCAWREQNAPGRRKDQIPMITDVVVAILGREALASVLPAVHTHGFGHVARVLTIERGVLRSQLKRMGVPAEGAPASIDDATTLLVLSAAARSPSAAGLLVRATAGPVWIVSRSGEWRPFDDAVALVSPAPVVAPSPAPGVPGLHDAPSTNPPATESLP